METPSVEIRRPSPWWLVLAAACAALAVGFAVAAIAYQRQAAEPIGEGQLFVEEAMAASVSILGDPDPEVAVRAVRNTLEIEAVSLVDPSGRIVHSSSPSLVDETVANSLLAFSIERARFAAVATPITEPVQIDGVPTWRVGDVLYQVAYPTDEGSVLLHYDISELLERRARPAGIQSETIQLLGLTAIFAVIGTSIAIGHLRASRRYQVMAKESQLLRQHAEALTKANLQLEDSRRRAEKALELAEEKIRIRSEFVLMINHELRTPLTSVITGARLLADGELGPVDRGQVLKAMVDDGTRLQEMIDQILAVARIENRGLSYELAEMPVHALHDALIQANADILADPQLGEDVRVVTDVNAVALVVNSLAENARIHGASAVAIAVSTERQIEPAVEEGTEPVSAIYVSVSDDGPGIDPEFLPRVFQKFEKSSFSPGTGLGLYMARTIIEALEGSIAVATSPSGTVFEIALPTVSAREGAVR